MQNLMPQINTPDQLFHDGDPTQGIEGTIVTADYLNNHQGATRDLQQELLNVLSSAHIQPDPKKTDQLLTALRALLLSRKNPFGDIKSDGTVERALENLGLQDVKAGSLNNLYTNHSRSVLMELPLLFPDYDTVLAAQSGAEYMYPQGFVVTGEKIYLSYTVEPKQTRNVIVQYTTSGEYEGYYYVDNGGRGVVSEGLVVTTDYGGLRLFMSGENGLLKQFSLDGAISGSVLPLIDEHDVGVYNQFSYRKNRWVVEQSAPEVGGLITRTVFAVYDFQFRRTGTFTLPLHDSGYITESTDSYARRFTKRQGIAVGDDYIACSYGGYFNTGASAGFNQFQGVKVFSPDGVKLQESILHPQKMIDVLTSQGFTPSRIENEGICISDDGGSIYSLYIFLERGLPQAYQKGIVLMKEFSTGRDAIDFRQAAWLYTGFDVSHASIGTFPRSAQGLVNPVLGTVFTSLSEILAYMRSVSQKWFCLHTTTTPIKDLSGNDIPADNYVFIKNANNQTFYITQESAEGGIKYKAVTTDSGEYGFQRQREAIWSNVITIAQKSDGEDQFNRIVAASKSGSGNNQDKILVVDQQASEGNNTLVIGGASSVFRSATVIDFATNQDANATGGEKRWRIDSSGNLRPYTDNTYSIGYASWRPAQVYSATGSISTSDRTRKQDETILSDAEKRVARKLLGYICRFRFRDAVSSKGNAARWHVGVIAQDVQKVFSEEGLDAFDYGILCRDEYPAEYEVVYGTRMELGPDGLLAMEEYDTGERKLVREAGEIMSVRNDELHYFMLASLAS
ncbi:tail fiber domain-containing protein [Escherichia coli]|nr:tail fiber domain-containing protein [Escherichia coli]